MQFMLLQLEFIILLKMDFSKGFNVHLATLFGIGKIPGGGTWASFIVLIIALYEQNAETASFLAFLSLIIGPNAYRKLIALFDSEDPKEYVLDEVIGYLIIIASLSLIQFSMENNIWILSFILFRIFDVIKLWPAGNLEKLHGGHGILLDDIAAGFQTLFAILLLDYFNLI